jgi:hypothetical protein
MGKVFDRISDELAAWLGRQKVFFVATAPLAGDGLVNCSPKGLDTFRILGPTTVAYLDLTGSGIETVAHLKENGRVVLMFCAFEGPPKIVRLHGRGEVIPMSAPEFAALLPLFPNLSGARAVVRVEVGRVSDSCGYAVPKYEYVEDRDALCRFADSRGEQALADYRAKKNAASLDGLPGL